MHRIKLLVGIGAALLAIASPVRAQDQKAEINIINNRAEPVVMLFQYAFRQYTWNLMQHQIPAGEEITYRFPSNIPGCERLRDWGITDGLLTLSNARGMLCQKRISLCDRYFTTMAISEASCNWSVGAQR